MLNVQDLELRVGARVLMSEVSFRVSNGDKIGLVGRNGAGKTSTLEACEGVRRAASGTIRVLGADISTINNSVRARIGVMLQDGGIAPNARVRSLVRHYCTLYARGVDAGGKRRVVV